MHRNEQHWLTEEELEHGTFGESLEGAVVEIRNLLSKVEYAFRGVELMAAAIRSKELGFDRDGVFWPTSFPREEVFGMAWRDDEELVAQIEPPPDLEEGWKFDPHYGARLRYWDGKTWGMLAAPAAGNLDVYRQIAAGEAADEEPDPPPVHI
jgi:hypothetical protein